MQLPRSSGVLLHPTSLPGPYGIGDLGPEAFRWLEFLAEAGCRWWQVLPLGPTGYGDSPYAALSAFAGNPLLINPERMQQSGLITEKDLQTKPDFDPGRVDFSAVSHWKAALFERAHQRLADLPEWQKEFDAFRQQQAEWLQDYTLYRAIKSEQSERAWNDWPAPLRDRQPEALAEARNKLAVSIERVALQQFIFFRQWGDLRARAAELGIGIIGDIPIYVAQDSAEVWANRHLFHLDEKGRPIEVAGVPPDYFSKTGQLWGNPLYRWDLHAQNGFAWWLKRLKAVFELVDWLRLDHFRGFAGYWAVPAGEKTAEKGRWEPGPGADFFNTVKEQLGELPLIAEDLGEITPDVIELRDRFKLPGMKILQFAFDDDMEHKFLPHNYTENFVAYTGTHDNDTTRGWYATAPKEERAFCRQYLDVDGGDIAWDLVRAVWASAANVAIAPMQDLLDLGTEARMNFPSRPQGNWAWRMHPGAAGEELAKKLGALNRKHGRTNKNPLN